MTPENFKKVKKENKFNANNYFEKDIEPYLKSKGVQKMWNYFIEITKTDYFLNFVKEMRKKYNIPPRGFKLKKNKSFTIPPKNFSKQTELRDEIIKKICEKYKLHYFDYCDVMEEYIYYNILFPLSELSSCGLFYVSDVIDEKEEPFGELFQKSDDMAYPIAIRISPYASQRDLIDFIKNKVIWEKEIKFLQDKYKDKNIKIGKIKSKNKKIQKRNDFIFKHQNLPRKKIMSLVNKKFKADLDHGEVCKIISLERKRRKELSS